MRLTSVIARLKAHREALRRQGVAHVAVFGSTARGDALEGSDVDLAVELAEGSSLGGFSVVRLEHELSELLGSRVDLVVLPVRNARVGAEIERDRVVAF